MLEHNYQTNQSLTNKNLNDNSLMASCYISQALENGRVLSINMYKTRSKKFTATISICIIFALFCFMVLFAQNIIKTNSFNIYAYSSL